MTIDAATAVHESGDLIDPIANGRFKADAIRADLAALCKDEHPGREDDTQVTVFKAVGTALEDLASAVLVYDSLRE